MSTMPDPDQILVFGGVDTHLDTNTVAVVDAHGRMLGHATFPATPLGYRQLHRWILGHGQVVRVGIEGTGSYGAGLARYLRSQKTTMIEVDRPDRKARRTRGKTDPLDAEAAARAVLNSTATGTPKDRDGNIEALRMLRITRRSAVKARAKAITQLKSLIVTAPAELREQLRHLSKAQLLKTCARLRPETDHIADPLHAAKYALRSLAQRIAELTAEITAVEKHLEPLVKAINPTLYNLHGLGPDTAGQLLVTAGQNHSRITSPASLARLCGTAPIPASSGRTDRHRLNRGGDRQANAALHRIIIVRLKTHQPTRDYYQRRKAEGLGRKDIIRCLKRNLSREIYRALTHPDDTKTTA